MSSALSGPGPICKPPEVPELCAACVARHHGVCGALQPPQLATLSRASRKRLVKAGTELPVNESDEPVFANILAGVVKLTRMLSDGRQQIVGLQFAPDFVGRPFLPERTPHAQTVTDAVLCTFPRAVLEALITQSPELENRLYRQALTELDDARELAVSLGRKNAQERIATVLLLIASHSVPGPGADASGATSFDLPITRGEMADFTGLTIETVSRQLTLLKAEGLIRIGKGRRIVIPDLAALEAVSGN